MCYGIAAALMVLMLLGSAGLVFATPVPPNDAVERRAQAAVGLLILLIAIAVVAILVAAVPPR